MELTSADFARIPAENLRVPRAEFVAVWAAAEEFQDARNAAGVSEWAGWGVVSTCRWLATAISRPCAGAWHLTRSPVTRLERKAYPELIEAEWLAADRLFWRRPVPEWVAARPGWLESVVSTLSWAWRGSRRLPTIGGELDGR
jgi:hypothetical protein